jgi:hypothetical protein
LHSKTRPIRRSRLDPLPTSPRQGQEPKASGYNTGQSSTDERAGHRNRTGSVRAEGPGRRRGEISNVTEPRARALGRTLRAHILGIISHRNCAAGEVIEEGNPMICLEGEVFTSNIKRIIPRRPRDTRNTIEIYVLPDVRERAPREVAQKASCIACIATVVRGCKREIKTGCIRKAACGAAHQANNGPPVKVTVTLP